MDDTRQVVPGPPGGRSGRRVEVREDGAEKELPDDGDFLSWLATLLLSAVATVLTVAGLALYFQPLVLVVAAAGTVALSVAALSWPLPIGIALAIAGSALAVATTPYALVVTVAGLAFAASRRAAGRARGLRVAILVGLPTLAGAVILLTGFRLGK